MNKERAFSIGDLISIGSDACCWKTGIIKSIDPRVGWADTFRIIPINCGRGAEDALNHYCSQCSAACTAEDIEEILI